MNVHVKGINEDAKRLAIMEDLQSYETSLKMPLPFEDLTVILPTLNEAGNIKSLIETLQTVLPNASILVIDDNSTDGTPDIVRDMEVESQFIGLIERNREPCLTDSIEQGIKEAKTEYVAWMDADFSHPPFVLEKLFETAVIHGCCKATRFVASRPGGWSKKESASHFSSPSFLTTVFNFSVRRVLGLKITDCTGGFIACRKELLFGHRLVGDHGEYLIELMLFLHQ